MSLLLSLLAAAAAGQDGTAKPVALSTEFVIGASTEELANAVLPPAIAAKVKGHRLSRPHLSWFEGYPARFWGEVTPISPGFCRRTTHYVPMPQKAKGTLTPGRVFESAEVKMAADCSTASEPFIHLNNTSPEQAVEILQWLNEAQRDAAGPGELNFELECRSYQLPGPCARGARSALSALSLDRASIVGNGTGHVPGEDWTISVGAAEDPSYRWQLSIVDWGAKRPRLLMRWAVVPPL